MKMTKIVPLLIFFLCQFIHCLANPYVVKIRNAEGNSAWHMQDIKTATVDLHDVRTTYYTQFDMDSPTEVMVEYSGDIESVDIRPTSKGIEYRQEDNIIYFKLDKPTYLSIEFNGDRFGNLQLFADRRQEEVSSTADSVMYFGPGIHKRMNVKEINIPSNTTVYLDKEAILEFGLKIKNAENVRVIGRGTIKHVKQGIVIEYSKNILIDGITILNPEHYSVLGGQSANITIRNMKSFSSQLWSDGIDVMSCSDIEIDNVYMRNSDDCIAIYGHRWVFEGDSRNISVRNSILWADNAHPINIGSHGNTKSENGDTIDNLNFVNIDILEHHEKTPIYQGCMAVTCGDNVTVSNLTFEDIRIENIEEGKLFFFAVQANGDFNEVPGKRIENVLLKNIVYKSDHQEQNQVGKAVICGFDESRIVSGITLENVIIGDRKLGIDDIESNEFVEGIIIE